MFAEPRDGPIRGAPYTGRYDAERPTLFRGTRSHESRGGVIRFVGIGAQCFKVKYVVAEPRSGPILGATIHGQLRFDSPPCVGARAAVIAGGRGTRRIGPGPRVWGLNVCFWARESAPSWELRYTGGSDPIRLPSFGDAAATIRAEACRAS